MDGNSRIAYGIRLGRIGSLRSKANLMGGIDTTAVAETPYAKQRVVRNKANGLDGLLGGASPSVHGFKLVLCETKPICTGDGLIPSAGLGRSYKEERGGCLCAKRSQSVGHGPRN